MSTQFTQSKVDSVDGTSNTREQSPSALTVPVVRNRKGNLALLITQCQVSRINDVRLTRAQTLTFGPFLLVVSSYIIAAPSRANSIQAFVSTANEDQIAPTTTGEPIRLRCESTANSLQTRLSADWTIIVREPYVIGGDLSTNQLDEHFQQTIVPTVRALEFSYFSSQPSHPTTIFLCTSDERFRELNLVLDDQERNQYSGLYSRKHRRIIVNIASGDGTLAHELTHALAHADFPTMPEWFDEGLASLHEECAFSIDGFHLVGQDNWRSKVAFEALDRGDLRLIEDVTSKRFGSSHRANVDYAHVRTLCLYLQELGLLESFYRSCRANSTIDPTGLRTLCEITNAREPRLFDDAFRNWLISHPANSH